MKDQITAPKLTASAGKAQSTIKNDATEKTNVSEGKVTNAKPAPKIQETGKKVPEPVKPVMTFDDTVEVIQQLHAKMKQRQRLITTIKDLEKFEVEIQKEEDQLGGGRFQGCTLKVTDDNSNSFMTNNPVVISAVANFVKDMCEVRLEEIEATIVLP